MIKGSAGNKKAISDEVAFLFLDFHFLSHANK